VKHKARPALRKCSSIHEIMVRVRRLHALVGPGATAANQRCSRTGSCPDDQGPTAGASIGSARSVELRGQTRWA
jgi:hypothetical protein